MFKKLFGIVSIFALAFAININAATLKLNTQKSVIKWEGKKVVGRHFGTVKAKDGSVDVNGTTLANGTVNVNMTTIVVDDLEDKATNAKLTGHLKSDDFFSVEKFNTSTFKLKSVKEANGKYTVTGDLTIKGTTLPITFPADLKISDKAVSVKGEVKIDRTKYDIKYGSGSFFDNLGDKAIDNEFTLTLDLNFGA